MAGITPDLLKTLRKAEQQKATPSPPASSAPSAATIVPSHASADTGQGPLKGHTHTPISEAPPEKVPNDHQGEELTPEEKPLTGIHDIFDDRGHRVQQASFKEGKLHGKYYIFYPNQKIKQELTYVDGVLYGPLCTYDTEGHLDALMPYEEGKLHGICTTYKEGRVRMKATYAFGMLEGPTYIFSNTEKLSTVIHYHANRMHGQMACYNDEGKLIKETMYVNGVQQGEMRVFFPSGKLLQQGMYKNGVPDGEVLQYYDSGHVRQRDVYENGKLHSREIFDTKGHSQGKTTPETPAVIIPPSIPLPP